MELENLSFEKAMSELERIVETLEKGDMTLDESIEAFQKGIELSRYCSKRLDEIERKITVLIEDQNGEIREEPLAVKGIMEVNQE